MRRIAQSAPWKCRRETRGRGARKEDATAYRDEPRGHFWQARLGKTRYYFFTFLLFVPSKAGRGGRLTIFFFQPVTASIPRHTISMLICDTTHSHTSWPTPSIDSLYSGRLSYQNFLLSIMRTIVPVRAFRTQVFTQFLRSPSSKGITMISST